MQRSSSPDSLFDEHNDDPPIATRTCPPIPGLYIFPGLLPPDIASQTLCDIAEADIFLGGTRDQVMLFEAPPPNDTSHSSLPGYIHRLLSTLSCLLSRDTPTLTLAPHLHRLLFSQPLARQAIINLYPAGTGIAPHIDLVGRYADGVVGCSVIGGCVMTFSRAVASQGQSQGQRENRHDVYLPPRSVYILSGPARWDWTHGIEARSEDVVERKPKPKSQPGYKCELEKEMGTETILRDLRLSITFRWLKPGANVLS
ncbi:Hypothetical Protein CGB_D9610C [Cryptococcus gattii WM276]|uniref:Fe2OG dioxygenase domain-containing protein n=2 Tax=Cryptococcus gattii TaxID=37769 RepID=E6R551_CRYGW|nr:Hypothetical Protein CGB_D9610C [Cryptococcus gattii WM276]ADV22196.1 Hypothetical Protein CGB_D9610C [Cryptococcus gattii WM276]KIR80338.1 hypothetical protein I306_02595 [Cryptococcus gattii EJB2]KJE00305.1 hypothetical protein I311_06101 [Cryptococcus gattii NT-10]